MDEQRLTIKVIIQGQEIPGSIVDGGSRVNVINKTTHARLGITKWQACPFWLRMANTRIVQPLVLIRQLDIVFGGHTFQILVVLLYLDALGAYPLLLGNIKQNWQKNLLTFWKWKTKIRVSRRK